MKIMKCISIFYLLLMVVSVHAQFTHPMIFEINAPLSIAGSYNYGPQSGTGWGITKSVFLWESAQLMPSCLRTIKTAK
jgi:hypothetical protein